MADAAAAGAAGMMVSAGAPVLGALYGAWYFYTKGVRKAREDFPIPQAQAALSKYLLVTMFMIFVCALYGFVGALVINTNLSKDPVFVPGNAAHAAGLINGAACFFTAIALGYFGATAVRCGLEQPRLFVAYVLINIYIEAFALYGLILALVTVAKASATKVDLAPDVAVPFAIVDILANYGGIIGSVLPGYAIMQVGVVRPDLVMKCMIPVVMSGVTGIYGLISCIVEAGTWPPAGENQLAGLLYIVSSVIIAYVGYHGVRGMEEDPSTFVGMVVKLINGQSVGLAGLVYSLVVTGSRKRAVGDDGAPSDSATMAPTTLLAKGLVGGSPVFGLALLSLPLLFAFLLGARRRPSTLGDALLA